MHSVHVDLCLCYSQRKLLIILLLNLLFDCTLRAGLGMDIPTLEFNEDRALCPNLPTKF